MSEMISGRYSSSVTLTTGRRRRKERRKEKKEREGKKRRNNALQWRKSAKKRMKTNKLTHPFDVLKLRLKV